MSSKSIAPSRTTSSDAPVQNLGHAGRIAERAVETLQAVVDEVELVRDGVRVREHHDKRARRDPEPRVAARNEDRHDGHDDDGDARRDDPARKRGHHARRVALDDFAVRFVEQAALVVFAPVRLHGKNVRDGIRKLTGQLVLSACRLLVQAKDALVHEVRNRRVDSEQYQQDADVSGHARHEQSARADDRDKHGHEREVHRLDKLVVRIHELRGLAHERTSETVGMKAHGLVAQRIEALRGQVVRDGNLQLEQEKILQFTARLAKQVDKDKRDDVRPKDRKHLVRSNRLRAHAVDDKAHHEGVAVGKQRRKPDVGAHEPDEQPLMPLRGRPVVMQRTTSSGRSARARSRCHMPAFRDFRTD